MTFLKTPWRSFLWLALLLVLLLWPIHRFVEGYYLEGLSRKNEQTLDLFVANLQGTLQRYEVLPQILGRLPSVQQALLNPTDANTLQTANTLLKSIQQQTEASVIYLMNTQGLTLAASNWNDKHSFIGNSFAFRPYFRNALNNGRGEFFGLGNISFKRGYYFGGAVYSNEKISGVIVVKVDLDFTETLWGKTPEQLFFGLLMQRKRHYLERIAMDAQAKRELEANVRTRTQDLQTLNTRLKQEVLERESTQQELVRAQDELIQAGKLSALGIMSASISHELNQPLAAIRSYTDNAKVLLQKQRLEEAVKNLGLIASLTERMASIIEHLRAFARRDRHASEHVALQPAIDDTLALIAKRQQHLGIEIIRDIPEATLWVEAGETRLRQILSNLVNNGLDALSESKTPRQLWLNTQVIDGWVILTLRDNGTGFTKEALQQAFEPFYTTKTSAKGLGLGLAICNSLIQALKGRLVLANHPEGGALITLYLRQIPDVAQLHASEDSFR